MVRVAVCPEKIAVVMYGRNQVLDSGFIGRTKQGIEAVLVFDNSLDGLVQCLALNVFAKLFFKEFFSCQG